MSRIHHVRGGSCGFTVVTVRNYFSQLKGMSSTFRGKGVMSSLVREGMHFTSAQVVILPCQGHICAFGVSTKPVFYANLSFFRQRCCLRGSYKSMWASFGIASISLFLRLMSTWESLCSDPQSKSS